MHTIICEIYLYFMLYNTVMHEKFKELTSYEVLNSTYSNKGIPLLHGLYWPAILWLHDYLYTIGLEITWEIKCNLVFILKSSDSGFKEGILWGCKQNKKGRFLFYLSICGDGCFYPNCLANFYSIYSLNVSCINVGCFVIKPL